MSYKLLVLEGVTERGLQLLKAEGWQIDQHKAMAPAELARIVGAYDAMTIRSGSQITAEVLEAGRRLKVIGRPGVGVDNVDLAAATRLGIMVMNSPMGNLVSTAELTLALLFAVARNVAQADAAMKAERWERKAFPGVELSGKRLGVVGFGRIGREVAARARALGMEIAAFDPFVAPAVADAPGTRTPGLPGGLPAPEADPSRTRRAPTSAPGTAPRNTNRRKASPPLSVLRCSPLRVRVQAP